MLRGNHPVKIDEKGRLKIPNDFRTLIEKCYGTQVFITSVKGDHVRIYPLEVWEGIETKLTAEASMDPSGTRFLRRVNVNGQMGEIDKQGRVLIHSSLRDLTQVTGTVSVLGQRDYLAVWNQERLQELDATEPFTEADETRVSQLLRTPS